MASELQTRVARMVHTTRLARLANDAGLLLTEIINCRDNAPVDSPERADYRAIGRRLEKGLAYISSALERANWHE